MPALIERPEDESHLSQHQPTPPLNALALIQQGIAQGMGPDQLSQLIDLHEKIERREAEKRWAEAMTAFRRECPAIVKRKAVENKGGGVRYKFAPLEVIREMTNPIEARLGIVIAFSYDEPEPGKVRATCRVQVGTHYQDFHATVTKFAGYGTTAAQDDGSAQTYAARYAYVGAMGIRVIGEDTDANRPEEDPGTVSARDAGEITRLMDQAFHTDANRRKFLDWLGNIQPHQVIDQVEDIPSAKVQPALAELRRVITNRRK